MKNDHDWGWDPNGDDLDKDDKGSPATREGWSLRRVSSSFFASMTVFLCFASWFGCVSLFFLLPRWVVFLIALKRVCEAGAQKWHFLGEFFF